MGRLEHCKFCGEADSYKNLVDPCDCYKKFEALRCHQRCLQSHITERAQSQRDGVARDAYICVICGKRFRVKMNWNFDRSRMFSLASMQSYCEFFIIIFTTCMMLFAVGMTLSLAKSEQERKTESRVILPMMGVVLLMVVACVKKIYERWKRGQMVGEVLDVL